MNLIVDKIIKNNKIESKIKESCIFIAMPFPLK